MYDLGDPVPLGIDVADAAGAPSNAVTIALTITLPDGTSVTPTVTNPPAVTGSYTYDYATSQAGRHTVRWVTTTPTGAYTDTFDVDESAPTGIVSLDDVKAHLNKTTDEDDEELRRFIDAATDFIEGRVGPVVRRTITTPPLAPSFSGSVFVNGPVISVTAITSAYGYGATYNVANFTANGSEIVPNYGVSTIAYPVTVTYVGGRAVVPALIRNAALDYVKWLYLSQRGPTPPPGSFSPDEFEVSAPSTVPYRILQALEPYASAVVA